MTKKHAINIVYSPQTGDSHKIFENHKAEIWHSKNKIDDMINVGMGWYSIRKPSPNDSIIVIEPFCILPRDYDPAFVAGFRYIFTWATKAFTSPKIRKKVVKINHPSCKDIVNKKSFGKDWTPWKDRLDEIVFIANNKTSKDSSELYSLRVKLADYLYKNSTMTVSWYGQIPLNKPYFKGSIKNKYEILNKVKFSVCCENSYHPIYTTNYLTEKMPEVWNAGAVPIYMGCYNIDMFGFPKNSYIDLRNFVKMSNHPHKYNINFPLLMQAISSFSNYEYNLYVSNIKNNVLVPNKLFKIISYDRMYNTLISTLVP